MDDLIQQEKISQNTDESTFYKSVKNLKVYFDDQNSFLAHAYNKGTAQHIKEDDMAKYPQANLFKTLQSQELIVVPLKAKNKVNGLIVADNFVTQKPITEDDIKMSTMLANQAGLAIENSHLYEMVMHKSHTDALTNLFNHGFFQDVLNDEIKIAKDTKEPLSLLMLDIDDFKKLNDTYGHQVGDIVLKQIATILEDSSRESDYPCRYGGEELAIILSKTNKDQAYKIAERIRERIAKHSFTDHVHGNQLNATVSIGLATYPDDAESKEELMTKADKAMYTAKLSGKNQTSVAEN